MHVNTPTSLAHCVKQKIPLRLSRLRRDLSEVERLVSLSNQRDGESFRSQVFFDFVTTKRDNKANARFFAGLLL
jgi:hypothetical protein